MLMPFIIPGIHKTKRYGINHHKSKQMTKKEMLEAIEGNDLSSIYSKSDVIKLLKRIDDTDGVVNITPTQIEKLRDDILIAVDTALSNIRSMDCVDTDNISFDIQNGNQVYADDIEVDFDYIAGQISRNTSDNIYTLLQDNLKCK